MTIKSGSAALRAPGAGSLQLPAGDVTVTRKVPFELVDSTQALDPFGPGAGVTNGAGDSATDSVAMKYYCALNFNVGGSIKKNITVERVDQDGPLSPGAFQCARECSRMGGGCGAFGVVGANCYLMSAVGLCIGCVYCVCVVCEVCACGLVQATSHTEYAGLAAALLLPLPLPASAVPLPTW